MTGKPIKARAANGRLPNGDNDHRQIQEIERVAWSLVRLPPEERASAALKAFPPSALKAALYFYAKGDTPTDACRKSGAHPQSFNLYLQSDNIGHDLRQVMKGVLEVEYAPAAFRFLNDAVHDVNMPARCRIDAAKIIVDRAGYVAAPPAPQLYERELEQMSMAELQVFIRDAEAKKISQMKDVTPAATGDDSAEDAPADDTPPPH